MSVILKAIKKAWGLLPEKGSRAKMIMAGIMLCFALVLPMMLGIYITRLYFGYTETTSMTEYVLAYVITLCVGATVTLPAAAMFWGYSWQTYSVARYGFADRERTKGAYNYFRCLGAGLCLMARYIVCFVLLQLAYEGAFALSEVCVYDGMAIPMIIFLIPFSCVALCLSVLFLWATGKGFLAPYYYGRGVGVLKAFKTSREKCKKYPFMGDLFFLVFALMSALSLVSVGVLFVLLVLPLMTFTYFTIAEHMDGNKPLEDQNL